MPTREIKTKFVLEGEQQYKRTMKDAADAIKVLNSEQKLAAAQYEATGDAEEYAAEQTRILKEQIEQQKRAVEAAEDALKKLSDNGVDKNSKQVQTWRTKLNNAKTSLTQMQTRLNKVGTELGEETDEFKKTQTAGENFHESLKEVAKGVDFQNTIDAIDHITDHIEAIIKAVGRAAKALWDMGVDAGQYADNVATAASQMGVDPETYQSWVYASRFIDTSVEDIQRSWQDIQKKLDETNLDYMANLAKMGIASMKTNGKMRESSAIFWDAIDYLHGLSDASDQAAKANELFGNDWRKLMPLITAGSKAYKERAEEGKQIAVVSNENIAALGEVDDKIQKVQAQFDAFKYNTLAELAPVFSTVADALSKAITAMNEFVQSEEGQAALAGLNEALTGLIDSFLGDDNGKGTFADIVNAAKQAVTELTGALDWITQNKEAVVKGFEAVGLVWAGLKVTKEVLMFLQLLQKLPLSKLTSIFGSGKASAEGLGQKATSDAVNRAMNKTATEQAAEASKKAAKASEDSSAASAESAKSASTASSDSSAASSESSSSASSASSTSSTSSSESAQSAADASASSSAAASEASSTSSSASSASAASASEAAVTSSGASSQAAIESGAASSQAAITSGEASSASAASASGAAIESAGASSQAAITSGSASSQAAITSGEASSASAAAASQAAIESCNASKIAAESAALNAGGSGLPNLRVTPNLRLPSGGSPNGLVGNTPAIGTGSTPGLRIGLPAGAAAGAIKTSAAAIAKAVGGLGLLGYLTLKPTQTGNNDLWDAAGRPTEEAKSVGITWNQSENKNIDPTEAWRTAAAEKEKAEALEREAEAVRKMDAAQNYWDAWRNPDTSTDEMLEKSAKLREAFGNDLAGFNELEDRIFEFMASGTWQELEDVPEDLPKEWFTDGENAAIGLANGIDRQAGQAINAAMSMANAVSGIVSRTLMIKSPSRVMENLGSFVSLGFAEGIDSQIGAVERAAARMSSATAQPISAASPAYYGGNQYYSMNGGGGSAQPMINATIVMDKRVVGEMLAPVVNNTIGAIVSTERV